MSRRPAEESSLFVMVSKSRTWAGAGLLLFVLAGCATEDRMGATALSESLYHAAVEAQQNAEYVAAVSYFRRLRERRPDDRKVLLGLARNLRYVGAAMEAVRILEERKQTDADDPELLAELGMAKLAAGKTGDAIDQLKAVLEIKPGNWRVYPALGVAYDLTESYDDAKEAYRKALDLSEDNPTVLNNMAISASLAGNIEDAIAILQRVASKVRRSPQIRQNLALFYGIKGELGKAEALARMDLDEEAVRNNLAFYFRFHKKEEETKTE